jgi:hypothetical protein
VENYVEQGAVDAQCAVVFDESEFTEAVHEKAHPGAHRKQISVPGIHTLERILSDVGQRIYDAGIG